MKLMQQVLDLGTTQQWVIQANIANEAASGF